MTAPIPARTVKHDGLHLRYLVIEETKPGDTTVQAWIGDSDDGPSICLNADQLDEIATDFQARAALMRAEVTR